MQSEGGICQAKQACVQETFQEGDTYMGRKMIGLCEAYQKYGFESVRRPRYTPEGFCEWCGKELPKRRTSCCCEECTRNFNLATNPAWGSASGGGYRGHIMRRDNYTCQKCGEFHALINENGIPVPTSDGELDVHHKIPVACGGSDAPDNLITLCRKCHKKIHKTKGERRWIQKR